MEKIEEEINNKIDLPNVSEEQEGYLIHLVISLVLTLIYIAIKNS